MEENRKLASRFSALPYLEKIEIAQKLKLLPDNYRQKTDEEVFKYVLSLVRIQGLTDIFSHEVEAYWKKH